MQINRRRFLQVNPRSGADGYIIKSVILNWDDESAGIILKNCLQAIKNISSNHAKQRTNARLLIVDTIMPDSNEPFNGKFIDTLMLALTHNGRIKSEKDFRKLLKGSGFDTVNIIRSPDPANFLSIIEAIPSN